MAPINLGAILLNKILPFPNTLNIPMKKLIFALSILLSIFVVVPALAAEESPVFELRIYTTHQDKMPDLLARFKNHTTKIFERHGMVNVGYWLPMEQKEGDKLYYFLKHKSRDAAAASWKAFSADPEWIKVRAESEAKGPIVKGVEVTFMTATEFSAIK